MSYAVPIYLLAIFIFALAVSIILGVYVYCDAKRRGMNALLWALVAALVPSFIGLIIYLLVRGNYADLRCPQCQAPVNDQFVVCPKCGAKLRPACPNCSMPVQSDWQVCPRCAQPLPEVQDDVQFPVRAKDRSIWKVLAIVLIVPVLLIGIGLISFRTAFSDAGSVSWKETTFEEYDTEMDTEAEAYNLESIMNWYEGLNKELNHAYALRYDYETDHGNEHYFLVYVPGTSYANRHGIGQSTSIFGTTVKLKLSWSGQEGSFYNIVSSSEKAPQLKIELDGKSIPCDVTVVDYNPTTYYIVPQYDELEPGATDFFMPERISVVQIVGNHNKGVQVVEYEDLALNILVGIDSAPYLDLEHDIYGNPDGTGGYDFKDGYEIFIEYKVQEDLILHEDMLRCLAFEQDGAYYLIDDRPDNGRTFREIDEEFYHQLESLFE